MLLLTFFFVSLLPLLHPLPLFSCLLPQRQARLYHCFPAVQQEQRRRLLAPWEGSGENGGEKEGALLWKWHEEMSMGENFQTSEGSRERCIIEVSHKIKRAKGKKCPDSWGKLFRKDKKKKTRTQNWNNYRRKFHSRYSLCNLCFYVLPFLCVFYLAKQFLCSWFMHMQLYVHLGFLSSYILSYSFWECYVCCVWGSLVASVGR